MPPQAFFVCSAIFHYLGPAGAVLLFAQVSPLGVAWLRIASAGALFALWRKPWRYVRSLGAAERGAVLALGAVLAVMNICFYLAIERLPLATVGAIEFLGPIGLAAAGTRTARNLAALVLVIAGVYALSSARLVGDPLAYLFAFANCGLFVLYVMLGHRIAARGATGGIDRLAAAMLVAMFAALPVGIRDAVPALLDPTLLGAAIVVGVSSSVIPYVCDQLAMARMPRSTFALFLALLPATATVIGYLALRQVPTLVDLAGVSLVIAGVAVHRPRGAATA